MNMRRLAFANLRANPTRFIATVLAVVVGTAFLGGALVLRDSLGSALEANSSATLRGVDVAVEPLQETALAGAVPGSSTDGTTPGTTATGTPPGTVPADPGAGDPQNTRSGSGGGFGEQEVRIPADLLPTVEGVAGVGEVAPILTGPLFVLGPDGKPVSQQTQGALVVTSAALNPYQVAQGEAPSAAGEVAIDQDTADQEKLGIGQTVDLATSSGPAKATIVGLVAGPSGGLSAGNRVIVVSEADAFAYLSEGEQSYDAIYTTTASGTTPDQLAGSVREAIGDDYDVKTGDQLRADSSDGLGGITTAISTALQGFAYLALFVGLFIIYNTFSIVVAQRVREFALLRAVGASGKQIKRSVRVEATIVGFVASLIGFGVGVLLFLALIKLVPQFSSLLGDVGVRITVPAVLQVLISGTIITVLSSIVPSWRAARTKPIEALRSAAIDTAGTNKLRAVVGLLGLGGGIAIMLLGVAISNFWIVILGPPVLFLGVLIGGPVLAAALHHRHQRHRPAAAIHDDPARRREHPAQPAPGGDDRQRAGHRRVPRGAGDRRRRRGAGLLGQRPQPVRRARVHHLRRQRDAAPGPDRADRRRPRGHRGRAAVPRRRHDRHHRRRVRRPAGAGHRRHRPRPDRGARVHRGRGERPAPGLPRRPRPHRRRAPGADRPAREHRARRPGGAHPQRRLDHGADRQGAHRSVGVLRVRGHVVDRDPRPPARRAAVDDRRERRGGSVRGGQQLARDAHERATRRSRSSRATSSPSSSSSSSTP